MSDEAVEKKFNLLDEPWIRVMTPDCRIMEVSLTEALLEAHHFKRLAGEMEAQNVAILRLLIAVVHTVFTRVDLEGKDVPVGDKQEALERWRDLMLAGRFPEEPVCTYLEQWHERFWLVHPERPFYQVPGASAGTENLTSKLNGEVSESNNKPRLFSFLSGNGSRTMSFAEGARWLLFINGFDDCAAKQRDKSIGSRSMTIAWLGKLGLVTAAGESLFESILLNMTMLMDGEELWPRDDLPVWELPNPCEEERRIIDVPQDLASLLTLQSRRVLLLSDDASVTGYRILGGDAFSEQNAFCEPMTLWRRAEDKQTKASYYQPQRHDRTRQIWREFGSLASTGANGRQPDDNGRCPGVVSWCSLLKSKGLLPRQRLITFSIACVRYDSSQSSSITDSFSDSLSFHLNLLTDAGRTWIRSINDELEKIDEAADKAALLALDLEKACGQLEKTSQEAAKAKERFYLAVDQPFRDWLPRLDPDQDSDERIQLIQEWQNQVRQIAMRLGRGLVNDKGDAAFIGRTVKDSDKKERHYSSPEAYRWFRHRIAAIYPMIKEEDEQHG